MKQAILVEPGWLELRDVPVPEPGPGELVVRVDVALTCGTDLKLFQRGHPKFPTPRPMGHELAGTVAAVGQGVDAFREGDALASVPTAPCGACRLCRRGQASLCPDAVGRMVFGAFGEYVRLPRHVVETNVYPRGELSADQAAALEPLACVVHGARRVDLAGAETTAIIGDGPIALLFAQLAMLWSSGPVVLAGKHATRLDCARSLGVGTVIDVTADSLEIAMARATDAAGADVVIECVGRPEVWEAAAGLVAPGGELLAYGGCPAGTTATFDTYRIHYEEVDIKGAFHYDPGDVRRALDLLRGGDIRIEPLVTHRRPLERVEEALELAMSREAIKVAVQP